MQVLVVDDEQMILQLAEKILSRSEIESVLAENFEQAISLFTNNHEDISVAIVDLFLGNDSGLVFLEKIRQIKPKIPCILSSGNAPRDGDIPEEVRDNTFFLAKPYRAAELTDMVKKAAKG